MDRRTLLLSIASTSVVIALVPAAANALYGTRVGRVSQLVDRGHSHCMRCQTTWGFVSPHSTMFIVCAGERKRGDDGRRNVASGVFPLCETCWSELTPAERLPFYRQVFDKWNSDGYATFDWPVWERSVLRERRDDTPFSHHFDSSGREVLTYTDPIGLAASPCGNDI